MSIIEMREHNFNLLDTSGYVSSRLKGLAELQGSRLGRNVIETQLAAIPQFGSPQTGPDGESNGTFLAAQAPLRLCPGAAQTWLMVKQRLLKVEALTGAGEKISCPTVGVYASTPTGFSS
jgi:hypothetical protein